LKFIRGLRNDRGIWGLIVFEPEYFLV